MPSTRGPRSSRGREPWPRRPRRVPRTPRRRREVGVLRPGAPAPPPHVLGRPARHHPRVARLRHCRSSPPGSARSPTRSASGVEGYLMAESSPAELVAGVARDHAGRADLRRLPCARSGVVRERFRSYRLPGREWRACWLRRLRRRSATPRRHRSGSVAWQPTTPIRGDASIDAAGDAVPEDGRAPRGGAARAAAPRGGVLVRNACSLISAGTERTSVETARASMRRQGSVAARISFARSWTTSRREGCSRPTARFRRDSTT